MARRPGRVPSLPAASRKVAIGFGVAALALVAALGIVRTPAAASSDRLFATASAAGASPAAAGSTIADTWGTGIGNIDLLDLAVKGLLVLILLFITLRVLARVQGAGKPRTGQLSVLESRTLAPKASLHLVAVGERRLVVGLTPGGMVALAELDAEELPEPETADEGAPAPAPGRTAPATGTSLLPPAIDGIVKPMMKPVDRFADRLAALLGASGASGSASAGNRAGGRAGGRTR